MVYTILFAYNDRVTTKQHETMFGSSSGTSGALGELGVSSGQPFLCGKVQSVQGKIPLLMIQPRNPWPRLWVYVESSTTLFDYAGPLPQTP